MECGSVGARNVPEIAKQFLLRTDVNVFFPGTTRPNQAYRLPPLPIPPDVPLDKPHLGKSDPTILSSRSADIGDFEPAVVLEVVS